MKENELARNFPGLFIYSPFFDNFILLFYWFAISSDLRSCSFSQYNILRNSTQEKTMK